MTNKLDEIEARLKKAHKWCARTCHKNPFDYYNPELDILYLLKIARAAMELKNASVATALGIHNHGDMCQVELCQALAKFKKAVEGE